ncbi:MAG: hypothetical protein ACM3SR_12995 [Ignavibacteriales bacterium]
MKKVLIVQSTFPPEGSSTVAVWMIEALKKECSVSLLTWKPIDLGEINRFHSTSLSNSELTVLCVNPALRKLIELDTDPGSIQKTAYLSRVCKRTRKNYDVIISTEYESDFGVKGIQYIHYPWFDHLYAKPQPSFDWPWYRKLWAFLKDILVLGF